MLVAGLALSYLWYQKATPVYETSAQLLVTKRGAEKLPIDPLNGTVGFEDSFTTQAQLIKTPIIVAKAVEKFRLNEYTSFRDVPQQNVVALIIAGLETARAGTR